MDNQKITTDTQEYKEIITIATNISENIYRLSLLDYSDDLKVYKALSNALKSICNCDGHIDYIERIDCDIITVELKKFLEASIYTHSIDWINSVNSSLKKALEKFQNDKISSYMISRLANCFAKEGHYNVHRMKEYDIARIFACVLLNSTKVPIKLIARLISDCGIKVNDDMFVSISSCLNEFTYHYEIIIAYMKSVNNGSVIDCVISE